MDELDSDIEQRIRRILIEQLDVSPSVLASTLASTPLLGRGVGLDSFEALALAVGIEKEFDIHFGDAELTVGLFESLAALTQAVRSKTRASPQTRPGGDMSPSPGTSSGCDGDMSGAPAAQRCTKSRNTPITQT